MTGREWQPGDVVATDLETIDGLRSALRRLDATALVFIDNRPPTALSSYRGYYDHLAIERSDFRHERTEIPERGEPFELNMAGYGTYSPGAGEVKIKADPTVADLIEALDLAIGEDFEGYKGGQFTMQPSTDLWVSEYGDCDRLRIASIEALAGRVDLLTREAGW